MAEESVALADLIRKAGVDDVDFLRELVGFATQRLMELDVAERIGADRYERTAERTGQRNGYRRRLWDTRVGTIELRVAKLRRGSYYPEFLEPRRRAERALVSVVEEAYIQGVGTRKADELVQALGLHGAVGPSPSSGAKVLLSLRGSTLSALPEFVLDGEAFDDLEGFYTAAERTLGVADKWGRNLDAFNDILRGGFGTPCGGFRIRWAHSRRSSEQLGRAETIRWLERSLPTCHPQSVSSVRAQLERARHGEGQTLFDILVDIISTHGPGGREAEDNVHLTLD